MSDASEVKRFIHWFGPDYDGSAQFSQEVVLASDFDRIMAERDELWKRATKFGMPGEMDTGESIEHYIKTLEQTVAELKAEIDELRKSECLPFDAYYKTCEVHYGLLNEEFKKAEATIARQAKQLELAKILYHAAIKMVDRYSKEKSPFNQTVTVEDIMSRYDKELETIEQGEGT